MWIINLYIIENAITGLYLSQLSIYIGLIVLRAAQCHINSKCLLIVASLGNIYSTDDVQIHFIPTFSHNTSSNKQTTSALRFGNRSCKITKSFMVKPILLKFFNFNVINCTFRSSGLIRCIHIRWHGPFIFASLAIQKHRIDMNCNDLLSFFHYKLSDYPVFFEYDVPFDCKSFARSFQENTHIMGLSCKRFMCFVFRECLQQT